MYSCVHKKSVNFAVLAELGRFPLHYDILKSLINYWYRFENLNEFSLLKDAYLYILTINYHGTLLLTKL